MSRIVTSQISQEQSLKAFGSFLSDLRKSRGLTQEGLIRNIDNSMEVVTLSRWENGLNFPQKTKLLQILDALKVTSAERQKCVSLLPKGDHIKIQVTDHDSYDRRLLWSGLIIRSGLTNEEIREKLRVGASDVSRWRTRQRSVTVSLQIPLLELLISKNGNIKSNKTEEYHISGEIYDYLIKDNPPTILNSCNLTDLDSCDQVIQTLWEMELAGQLGDEGDAFFFALEEQLWQQVQQGNEYATVLLAKTLELHCDWRGRHGYVERDIIAQTGLSLLPFIDRYKSNKRDLWIALMFQKMGTIIVNGDRDPIISAHKTFLKEIEYYNSESEYGIRASILASLANHYSHANKESYALTLIHQALQFAEIHTEITQRKDYLIGTQYLHTEILLHQRDRRNILSSMPDPNDDKNDPDPYGITTRLLQRANVFLLTRDYPASDYFLKKSGEYIDRFKLIGLKNQAKSIQIRL
jgi:transcriptional regulator with XRE-family HTH domain